MRTIMDFIAPLDKTQQSLIEHRINNKTKPLGSLGQLETLAIQLALILDADQPLINQPTQLVFAGDHGVSKLGVSIAGSEVTGQMVANFCHGGAAINAFCSQNNMSLFVVDCGTVIEHPDHPMLIKQRIAPMTQAFNLAPAMSHEQLQQGLDFGKQAAVKALATGANVVGIGEMGIGNTTSAAAIMHLITKHDIDLCVGHGTGVDDHTVSKKKKIISDAAQLHQEHISDALSILRLVGGFEITQMVGAMLAIAEAGKVILVDGFISSAAALIACNMSDNVRDYMIFSHCSKELGHQLLLTELGAEPILDLNLRLGEGSGCPLALPLLRSALAFYNEMASFEQANISVGQP